MKKIIFLLSFYLLLQLLGYGQTSNLIHASYPLTGTELVRIVQSGNDRQTNLDSVKSFIGSGGGGAAGVSSFNGRTGAVTPQSGDYSGYFLSSITGYINANSPLSLGGSGTSGSPYSISIQQANTSQNGYISNTDWNTFNNKVTDGAYPPSNLGFIAGTSISMGYGLINASDAWTTAGCRYVNSYPTNVAVSGTGCRTAYRQLANYYMPASTPVSVINDCHFNNVRVTTGNAVRYATASTGQIACYAITHLQTGTIQFPYESTGILNTNITLSSSSGWTAATQSKMIDYGARAYWYQINSSTTRSGAAMGYKTSVVANETMTWAKVNGSTISVGTYGTDGSTNNWSRIQYAVDGVTIGTFTPNGLAYTGFVDGGTTDGLMNSAIIISGLVDTLHTVTLTFLDGGKPTAIDYIGGVITSAASKAAPYFLPDAYHMSNGAGIGYNYSGFVTTQATMGAATRYIDSAMAATFVNASIIPVRVNTNYSPATDATQVQSDGIHPTPKGISLIIPTFTSLIGEYQNQNNTNLISEPSTSRVGLIGSNPSMYFTSTTPYSVKSVVGTYGTYAFMSSNYDYANSSLNAFNSSYYTGLYSIGVTGSTTTHTWGSSTAANATPSSNMTFTQTGSNSILTIPQDAVAVDFQTPAGSGVYCYLGGYSTNSGLSWNRRQRDGRIDNSSYFTTSINYTAATSAATALLNFGFSTSAGGTYSTFHTMSQYGLNLGSSSTTGSTTTRLSLAGTSGISQINLAPQPPLTSPNNGDTSNDSTQHEIAIMSNNIKGLLPRTVFVGTANTTVTATSATTLVGTGVGTTTLPAKFFVKGKQIILSVDGVYSTSVSGGNLTVNVNLCGTTVATNTITTLPVSQTNAGFHSEVTITCQSVTSGLGTFVINGGMDYGIASQVDGKVFLNNSGSTFTQAVGTTCLVDEQVSWSASGQSITATAVKINSNN